MCLRILNTSQFQGETGLVLFLILGVTRELHLRVQQLVPVDELLGYGALRLPLAFWQWPKLLLGGLARFFRFLTKHVEGIHFKEAVL